MHARANWQKFHCISCIESTTFTKHIFSQNKMCCYNVTCRFQNLSSNLNYYVANDAYEFFVITDDGRIK